MSRRHTVEFAPEALEHAEACHAWWEENRPKAPRLFAVELAAAVESLEQFPHRGKAYACSVDGMHRLLMPRTRYHVYYTIDDDGGLVRVHAIWHTSRQRALLFTS